MNDDDYDYDYENIRWSASEYLLVTFVLAYFIIGLLFVAEPEKKEVESKKEVIENVTR